MLSSLPVENCMHFIAPITLSLWEVEKGIPGIVGVLTPLESGQYRVIYAFSCPEIPTMEGISNHPMFSQWTREAGGADNLRFDCFTMPRSNSQNRETVLTLIQRSCGFRPAYQRNIAHAV